MRSSVSFQVAARPRYLTVTTNYIGEERQALAVTYPADWVVLYGDDPLGRDADNELRTVTSLNLAQRPVIGAKRWLDQHLLGLSDSELNGARMMIMLQRLDRPVDLRHESARLESGFGQWAGPRGSFHLRNTASALGPMLEVDAQDLAAGNSGEMRAWFVYPMPRNGEPQYEITVQYNASGRLKSRLHRVALDVVSRLRLVKGQ